MYPMNITNPDKSAKFLKKKLNQKVLRNHNKGSVSKSKWWTLHKLRKNQVKGWTIIAEDK